MLSCIKSKVLGQTKSPAANSRFAKAGVSYFYDSEVLNSSFVHLMKFSADNPRLRNRAKRYHQYEKDRRQSKKMTNIGLDIQAISTKRTDFQADRVLLLGQLTEKKEKGHP